MQNPFQAVKDAVYPVIPAGHPNRAVRRAVKQGRDGRLPQEWKQYLTLHPKLRAAIKAM